MKRILLTIILFAFTTCQPLYAADLKEALTIVFGHEGGYQNDPADPGNWTGGKVGVGTLRGTKFGIASNSYPRLDIARMTLSDAARIYQRDYWQPLRLDAVTSQIIATEIFDSAVNQGVGTVARRVQEAINLSQGIGHDLVVDGRIGPQTIAKLNAVNQPQLYINLVGMRYERYRWIATNNPKMKRFFKSWQFRIKDNVIRAVKETEARRRQVLSGGDSAPLGVTQRGDYAAKQALVKLVHTDQIR